MKLFLFISLGTCLVIAGCSAAPKVLLAQTQPTKIAQVKSGELKEAHASWWGFDKNDATECLQKAIDSGVSTLIVDNMGSDWIVSKPLHLVSNQQIIFADGVVVQAQKSTFHDKNDSLFNGKDLTNISLIGKGKVLLRMCRDDYADPKLYTKSEWRHGIALWGCRNVIVRNLTVTETGGDGLYLGALPDGSGAGENILVEESTFDKNYRQGISVISAENLTIRNCKLTNTAGTMPQSGIDFEPSQPRQRLVNCVVENCDFSDNKSGDLDIYLMRLNSNSEPVSITVKNCTFSGDAPGFNGLVSRSTKSLVDGLITLENCTFTNWLYLRNPILDGATYLFKNCTLHLADGTERKNSPIILAMEKSMGAGTMGGIVFQNVVAETGKLPLIDLRFQEPFTLSDQITGDISIKNGDQTSPFDLAAFIKKEQENLAKFATLIPATYQPDTLKVLSAGGPRAGNNGIYTRDKFTFLQYAKQGQNVTFTATVRKVYARDTEIELLDPSGKKIQTFQIPYDGEPHPFSFTAQQTGIYQIVRTQDFTQGIDINSANPGNGFLIDGIMDFLPTGGKLYFEVPAGVKDFNISISSDSSIDAALVNPQGKEVQRKNDINSLQLFSGNRADASKAEIWSIDLSHAVWNVQLHFYGELTPIVSTNPATLLK